MEREDKNPFVTQIDLEQSETRLNKRIDGVDKKHDDNYSRIDKTISIMSVGIEQLTESIDSNTSEMKGIRSDLKESNDHTRESIDKLDKTVMEHDMQFNLIEGRFKTVDEYIDEKKKVSGKWIGLLSAAFAAFISGMFGLTYVVMEFLLPWIFG